MKLFAKGTSLFQAHDVGKSHVILKSLAKNDTNVILRSESSLLPDNYQELWKFLESCRMPLPTCRTIWKHMVNCLRWLREAFSMKNLKSAYERCGLWPVDFVKYIDRMPAWGKCATKEDLQHLQKKLPTLINLGRKQNGLLCSDVLNELGSEWLLGWETDNLGPVARSELIKARSRYTPDEQSPLNRQGTLLLTGEHSKKLRRDAMELIARKKEEDEANENARIAEEIRKTQDWRDMAIAIRVMYPHPDAITEAFQYLTKDHHLLPLIRTYWTNEYLDKFDTPLPESLKGITNSISSLKKEDLMQCAVILLHTALDLLF